MGCASSRSAGADGVIETNRDPLRASTNTSDTANAVATSSSQPTATSSSTFISRNHAQAPAQIRFDFDSFPGRIIRPQQPGGGSSASDNRPRNTRLTILNMPPRSTSRRRSSSGGDHHHHHFDSSESAVIEQLQLDLVTIERIFQSLLGHPYHPGTNTITGGTLTNDDSCPPASPDAIENLPSVCVTADDLVDENNRSCCICFGDHNLNDEVVRLPCGHLFHRACVGEWLQKHCTCPFCRWELETENAHFESGRLDRMRSRRLRIRAHELERMSHQELKDLVLTRLDPAEEEENGGSDYASSLEAASCSELINKIKGSTKVDIISPSIDVPKKLETAAETNHNPDELRSMDIEGLRKILLESGIHCNYDEADDLDNTGEKERIVQLLLKNGNVENTLKSDVSDDRDDKCHTTDAEEEKEEISAQDVSQTA